MNQSFILYGILLLPDQFGLNSYLNYSSIIFSTWDSKNSLCIILLTRELLSMKPIGNVCLALQYGRCGFGRIITCFVRMHGSEIKWLIFYGGRMR